MRKSKGWTSERNRATRCCWPNDILPTALSRRDDIPKASNHSSMSLRLRYPLVPPCWYRRFLISTFSRAVSSGNSLNSWKRCEMCR